MAMGYKYMLVKPHKPNRARVEAYSSESDASFDELLSIASSGIWRLMPPFTF